MLATVWQESPSETRVHSILPREDGAMFVGEETVYNLSGHGSGSDGSLAFLDAGEEAIRIDEISSEAFESGLLNRPNAVRTKIIV